MRCKCGGDMRRGIAMQSTQRALPDFASDTAPVTISEGGPGRLIPVLKCLYCGWSVSIEQVKNPTENAAES